MNEQIGQVIRSDYKTILGQQVELQVKKELTGYRSLWSLDGNKWNCLSSISQDPDMALIKAGSGALVSVIHQNVKRRHEDG